MRRPSHFKKEKGHAAFYPVGPASFPAIAGQMSQAVVRCRREKIRRRLIDSTGLSGFHPPGIAGQYGFVERIASNSASLVKIAHVASPEWVRSGKFSLIERLKKSYSRCGAGIFGLWQVVPIIGLRRRSRFK